MHLYNAPKEIVDLLKNEYFNESCSTITIEPVECVIDVKHPFSAFINDETTIILLAKEVLKSDAKLVIFDANPMLTIRLVENGLNKDSILLVGIQNWSQGEYSFLRQNNIKFYPLKEISIDGAADVCDAIMSVCKDSPRLHVNVNESVLNSSGLTARELLYFIHRIRVLKSLKSMSFVMTGTNYLLFAKLAMELF